MVKYGGDFLQRPPHSTQHQLQWSLFIPYAKVYAQGTHKCIMSQFKSIYTICEIVGRIYT